MNTSVARRAIGVNEIAESTDAATNIKVVIECGTDWVATQLALETVLENSSKAIDVFLFAQRGRATLLDRVQGLREHDDRFDKVTVGDVLPGQSVDVWMAAHSEKINTDDLILYIRAGTLVKTPDFDRVLAELSSRYRQVDVFQFLSYRLLDGSLSRLAWCDTAVNSEAVFLEGRDSEAISNCMTGPLLAMRPSAFTHFFEARKQARRQARLRPERSLDHDFCTLQSRYTASLGAPLSVMQRRELRCIDTGAVGLPEASLQNLHARVAGIKTWMAKRSDQIVLLCDQPGWAFETIARAVIACCGDHFPIRIVYSADMQKDHAAAARLLFPDGVIPRAIHGFWRVQLFSLLESVEFHAAVAHHLDVSVSEVVSILAAINVSTGVPDYLRLEADSILKDLPRYHMLDQYSVGNQHLASLYEELPLFRAASSTLHDISVVPDANAHQTVLEQKSQDQRCTVAWIGNSEWGRGGGLKDHKGYQSVVRPLVEHFDADPDVEFMLIDKATGQKTQDEVMKALQGVDVLLCASVSEGTPLPVLEAMASGCCIVSTDVGIVSEVLEGRQREFIVPRDADSFITAIRTLKNRVSLRKRLQRENLMHVNRFNMLARRNWMHYMRQIYKHVGIGNKALKHLLIEQRSKLAALDFDGVLAKEADTATLQCFTSMLETQSAWMQVDCLHRLHRLDEMATAAARNADEVTTRSLVVQGAALGVVESMALFPRIRSTRLTASELLDFEHSHFVPDEPSSLRIVENVSNDEFEKISERLVAASSLAFVYSSNGLYAALNEAYRSIELGDSSYGFQDGGQFVLDSDRLIETALWHRRAEVGLMSALRARDIPFMSLDVYLYRDCMPRLLQQVADHWGGTFTLPTSAVVSSLYDRRGAMSLKNRKEILTALAAHPICQEWIGALR